jgi:5'(3')-deoxyribonucleotidase
VFCGDNSIILANFMIDGSVQNLKGFNGQGIGFTVYRTAEASKSWF